MKYNPNIFNKGVFPRFTSVTVYAKPSYSSDVLYEIKGFAGMTDGNYENVELVSARRCRWKKCMGLGT